MNVKTKYEWLENISIIAIAKFNRKHMIVGQILMKAKLNGVLLFNGIKQGPGMNSNNMYVYFKPNMTEEVRR